MAERQVLSTAAVRKQLPRLAASLSKADFDRLESLLAVFTRQNHTQADLAACLATVATGRTTQDQLADFRAFRQRLRKATAREGLALALEVDTRKRSDPQNRVCWFTQPAADRTADAVATFSQRVIAGLHTEATIPSRARESEGPKPVKLFVSCDLEDDQVPAQDLLQRLQREFKASRAYECETWDESQILVGEYRTAAIVQKLHAADFGLLLLSVSWLGKFEPAGDLSVFVTDGGKPVIPVVLKNIDEKRHRLHGLEERTLFRLHVPRGAPKSFVQCRTPEQKDQFAQELCRKIEQRLDHWLARRNEPLVQSRRGRRDPLPAEIDALLDPDVHLRDLLHAWPDEAHILPHVVNARAQETRLRDALDVDAAERDEARSVIAIDMLRDWASDPQGAPYCAILGEYGMGKTTTLKQFTDLLLQQRRDGDEMPLPIFIDLRLYSPGFHIRRDDLVPVMYSTELDSATSSVTPHRTDRQGIVAEKSPDIPLFSSSRHRQYASGCR